MPEPLFKQKISFAGGINYAVEPYKIGETELAYLSNARARYNSIEPIRKPLGDTRGLEGITRFQGLYAAGRYALVFGDGKAFYKDYDAPGSAWTQIAGFQMSATVERIYAELVPASSTNFLRKAGTATNSDITLTSTLAGTPQCVLCQDGENQAQIIGTDLSSRVSKSYGEWSIDNQEYVPIGKQMLFYDTRLYIVSPDGRQIYRSVSGRPLNFMVVIDQNGNKLAEASGAASVVSHSVDFEAITCIAPANTPDGSFFVSTLRSSYLVQPNYTSTLFGEPTFNNITLFSTGVINQTSYAQMLGDSAFIDFTGVRSYNAVLQTKIESKNNPFAARIYPWFQGVLQSDTCCILHDDYGFFSVNTIFGRAVIVYDTLRNAWESIDFWSFGSADEYVRQFAEIKTSTGQRVLLALTSAGVYQAFGSTTAYETASIYIGDWTSGQLTIEQTPQLLKLLFSETRETGTIFASIFVDSERVLQLQQVITQRAPQQVVPITPPFGTQDADLTQSVSFGLNRTRNGTKIGVLVEWAFAAVLDQVDFRSDIYSGQVSLQEATIREAGYAAGVPEITAFTPSGGAVGTIVTIIGENLETVDTVLLGDVECTVLEQAPTQLKFTIPNASSTNRIYLRNQSLVVESDTQLSVT